MIRTAASQGFTLTEMIVTVAIVSLLATIAVPSYTSQLARSNRGMARKAILQLVSAQETRFLRARGYGNTLDQVVRSASSGSLSYTINAKGQTTTSGATDEAYLITLERTGSPARYSGFSAEAVGRQLTRDPVCARFVVLSSGARTATNMAGQDKTGECWGD